MFLLVIGVLIALGVGMVIGFAIAKAPPSEKALHRSYEQGYRDGYLNGLDAGVKEMAGLVHAAKEGRRAVEREAGIPPSVGDDAMAKAIEEMERQF